MKGVNPFSISAPGFYGLNLSDSAVDLSTNYALVAENCVIDRSGRIASRKGWSKANSASADLGSNNITCIGELIEHSGTATTLCAGDGMLFKLSSGALVKLTYGGGGVAPTISAGNWQMIQVNCIAIFFQSGHDPLIYDPMVSTTTYRRLSEKTGHGGTVPIANAALGEFGRVWCGDVSTEKTTVYFSDLLSPHVWTGGTSGTIDLKTVWTGGDEIVAFASHNNFLFIFGRKQILIYSGADDPTTMALSDKIVGIGCIARDSVQVTGDDVWFLSDTGVRSLMRTIQEKSAPMRQISKNVHDEFQSYIDYEVTANIKSGFSAVNNIYVISLPVANKTYCFDTRQTLPDGSAKTTTWDLVPKCYCETKSRKFYMGFAGYLGLYSGYIDNATTYRVKWYSTWIDFGNPIQKSILKKILATVICSSNMSVVFKWAYDFNQTYYSEIVNVSGFVTGSEYGIAEWGTAEYTALSSSINTIAANGSSTGKVLQFGIEIESTGRSVSLQKIEVLTKDGRI